MEETFSVTIDVPLNKTYEVMFDSTSAGHMDDREYNLLYLANIQQHANNIVRIRGHFFLNELLDMLHLPRTELGQLVGWHDGIVNLGPQLNGEGPDVKLYIETQGYILNQI